jgi:hypothetical protein
MSIIPDLNNDELLGSRLKFWRSVEPKRLGGVYRKTINGKIYKWVFDELSTFDTFCEDINKKIRGNLNVDKIFYYKKLWELAPTKKVNNLYDVTYEKIINQEKYTWLESKLTVFDDFLGEINKNEFLALENFHDNIMKNR